MNGLLISIDLLRLKLSCDRSKVSLRVFSRTSFFEFLKRNFKLRMIKNVRGYGFMI